MRLVHMAQVPCNGFNIEVRDEEEAYKVSNILAQQHLFLLNENIIPDFSNVMFVEMWDKDTEDWEEYYNEEEDLSWEEVERQFEETFLPMNLIFEENGGRTIEFLKPKVEVPTLQARIDEKIGEVMEQGKKPIRIELSKFSSNNLLKEMKDYYLNSTDMKEEDLPDTMHGAIFQGLPIEVVDREGPTIKGTHIKIITEQEEVDDELTYHAKQALIQVKHMWSHPDEMLLRIIKAHVHLDDKFVDYTEINNYIEYMEAEEVKDPVDCWKAWCDDNEIEHEYDNCPYEK